MKYVSVALEEKDQLSACKFLEELRAESFSSKNLDPAAVEELRKIADKTIITCQKDRPANERIMTAGAEELRAYIRRQEELLRRLATEPIGVVTVPTLFQVDSKSGSRKSLISLRTHPSPTAAVMRGVSKASELLQVEFASDQSGVLVFEKKPGWFQVRAGNTTGWIDEKAAGQFLGMEELVGPKSSHNHFVAPNAELHIEVNSQNKLGTPIDLTRPVLGLYEPSTNPQGVFVSPDTKSKKLREINGDNLWVAKIDGTCPCGAIVTARKGDWLQLAKIEGDRSELIAERGWTALSSGKLHVVENPTVISEMRANVYGSEKRDEIPIKILETRRVDGHLWTKANFDAEDACGEKNANIANSRVFWTRVFSDEGEKLVWFHPRGC